MTTASPTPGEPAELEALVALAQREHRAGRLAEAAAACRQILAIRPGIAEAHNELGIILAKQHQLVEARARFEQALALRPGYAEAHNNLGNVLLGQGKLDEADARYRQALTLSPNYAEAHHNLGTVLWKQGRLDEAAARFGQVLALCPDYAQAHNNLGNVLLSQGRLDEAEARFAQAAALSPDYAEAHNHLGIVRWKQGKLVEAAACYERALALKPDLAEAHNNLANVLKAQDKLDEATAHYRQALALRPDFITAQLGLATCYLIAGDYERGWPEYEARRRIAGLVPRQSVPRWNGEPLEGRSLLLVAEQGLGDTFLFVRYARVLKERGARVVLACTAALGRLLAPSAESAVPAWTSCLSWGRTRSCAGCDFYLPLLSVPGALGTAITTIPRDVPYLWADAALLDEWQRELAEIGGVRIGIAWQGSRDFDMDHQRSIPLANFAPLARLPGVQLISLQKGFGSEQIATADFPVLDLSGRLDNAAGPFMDTAAVIRNLDLVVTADTAIAHLAGRWARQSGLRCRFRPIGFGCAIATNLPGIPPRGFSAKPHRTPGRTFSVASPAQFKHTAGKQYSACSERGLHQDETCGTRAGIGIDVAEVQAGGSLAGNDSSEASPTTSSSGRAKRCGSVAERLADSRPT